MTKQEVVDSVKRHARLHYGVDGWDYVVECWEDEDILLVIGETHSAAEAIARVRKHLEPLVDMRLDVQSEIF